MVLTEARYLLRLESGERAGDTVPIPPGGLTVGRKPENGLQIAESSVSGKHAELAVSDAGVTLRDLGSTNGTFVGSEKIDERRLVHGDEVRFGNARASFLASDLLDGGGAPAGNAAPAAAVGGAGEDAGEAVRMVGTDRVAASKKRGALGIVLIAVLLIGGGAAAFFLLNPAGGGVGAAATLPVVEVPGNLLDDGAFEGEAIAWEDVGTASAFFYADASHRATGATGYGVELAGGEWARSQSPVANVRARRGIELTASVDVTSGAQAGVGLELTASLGDRAPFIAWSETLADTGGFVDVSLTVPALPGYDRVRAVVAARGEGQGGAVAVDDVALVEVDAGTPVAQHEDDALFVDAGGRIGALVHVNEVPLVGLRLRTTEADGPRLSAGTLQVSSTPNGARFRFAGGADGVLSFRANLTDEPFIATTGAGGFRAYGASFEDVRAQALLIGGGMRLMRFSFESEVTLSGSLSGGTLNVQIDPSGASGCDLQLGFREERQAALTIADEARELGLQDPGQGFAAWTRILDDYPFERRLVEEAEAARGRLLQDGHGELNALAEEFERARFFGLADLFARTGEQVTAVAERYAGTEIEVEARELFASIEGERQALAAGRRAFEAQRLEAVLGVLERAEWRGLAERVGGAMEPGGAAQPNGGASTDG